MKSHPSRVWLALICWPSELSDRAFYGVSAALLGLCLALFLGGLNPPAGLGNLCHAETAREARERMDREEAQDRADQREADALKRDEDRMRDRRQTARDAERQRLDDQEEPKKSRSKKGGEK